MKSLTAFSLLLITLVANGQESTNPFIKQLINRIPDSDNYVFQNTSNENRLVGNLLPKDALNDFSITTKERMYVPAQVNSVTINVENDFSPYLGSSTTRNFELGNTRARSTYIFDATGNLRSSQFSISFGKKK